MRRHWCLLATLMAATVGPVYAQDRGTDTFALERELADVQAERRALAHSQGPEAPPVQALDRRIASLRIRLAEHHRTMIASLDPERRALEYRFGADDPKVKALALRIAGLRASLCSLTPDAPECAAENQGT